MATRIPKRQWTLRQVLAQLKAWGDPRNIEGMRRFKVFGEKAFGVPMPKMRALARQITRDHQLAEDLWLSRWHEARIVATLVDEPAKVTATQADRWMASADSWAAVDGACINLFADASFAWDRCARWALRSEEFIRRAGFSLMAALAVHDKQSPDERFADLLKLIEAKADDDRNFVKKAVNWALRQIGKRNQPLNQVAIECARRIREQSSSAAKWIAADALRELCGDAVQARLATRSATQTRRQPKRD